MRLPRSLNLHTLVTLLMAGCSLPSTPATTPTPLVELEFETATLSSPDLHRKLVLVENGALYRVVVSCIEDVAGCRGELTLMLDDPALYVSPSWSPKGDRIAFASDLESKSMEALDIFIIGEDGGVPSLLAQGGRDPDWSPSGTEVVFASWKGGGAINLVSLEGEERILLQAERAAFPHLAPGGSRLAFTGVEDGVDTLFIAYPEESAIDAVALDPTGFMEWSPNGDRLSFVARREGTSMLFVSNLGESPISGNEQPAFEMSGDISHLAWSPDGTKIAFVSMHQGNRDVYSGTLGCFGQTYLCLKNIQQITNGPETETDPTWLCDSQHLLYLSRSGSSWRMEIADIANGEAQVVLDGLISPRQMDAYCN